MKEISMSDWGSDARASEELVIEEVKKLLTKDSEHPLLKYWVLKHEDAGPDGNPKDLVQEKAIHLEMKNRRAFSFLADGLVAALDAIFGEDDLPELDVAGAE